MLEKVVKAPSPENRVRLIAGEGLGGWIPIEDSPVAIGDVDPITDGIQYSAIDPRVHGYRFLMPGCVMLSVLSAAFHVGLIGAGRRGLEPALDDRGDRGFNEREAKRVWTRMFEAEVAGRSQEATHEVVRPSSDLEPAPSAEDTCRHS